MRRLLSQVASVVVAALLSTATVAQEATSAPGGVLRVLDKITGITTDLELQTGESVTFSHLTITLSDCRYPSDNPSGDAFELITVMYRGNDTPVFRGWMIASAPGLNAMDHPRYDVWPLRCITS